MSDRSTSDAAEDKFRIIEDPDDVIKTVNIYSKLGLFKGTNQFACSGDCGTLITVSEKKAAKLRKMKKPKVTCKSCKKVRKARMKR